MIIEATSAAAQPAARQEIWVNLFPEGGHSYSASGYPLTAKPDKEGGFRLTTSAISDTDARCFGYGSMKEILTKPSPKSPDFRGELDEPREFQGHVPTRYRVAAWWKIIRNGQQAGRRYIAVCMTPI